MKSLSKDKKVLIIAGETSGDTHGARLVQAMKRLDRSLSFCGIGGDKLKNEGVEILFDAAEISVVGITEVFSKMPAVVKSYNIVKNVIKTESPDLVILIDFPDFNLNVARIAKNNGLSVLYYISPQIWAWRSGRVHKIKRSVDHMAVILPFEKEFYSQYSVPATFVGHPLLDYYHDFPERNNSSSSKQTIGVLPGSRHGEIERNLPVMLAAVRQLQNRFEQAEFLVSKAPSIKRQWMETYIAPYRQTCKIELVSDDLAGIVTQCSLVIAASGTATLETAILGIPMVIVYRVSPVSYILGRSLVKVNHIGLVNIIADERVVPELIQDDATPAKIAQTAGDMLSKPDELNRIHEKLKIVRQRLGSPGAAEKTAEIGMLLLNQYAPGHH